MFPGIVFLFIRRDRRSSHVGMQGYDDQSFNFFLIHSFIFAIIKMIDIAQSLKVATF
jgi:hypothetical protein